MTADARAFLCAVALALWPGLSGADDRVALVIGNGAYRHTAGLVNPPNDGRAMAGALRRLGFQVIEGLDLDHKGMLRALREFAYKLEDAEVGLFFFAGHGLQVDGKNWLVPVDAELAGEIELEFENIELDDVIELLERHERTNLVFLDACRNNPLAARMSRGRSTRSVSSGLAAVNAGQGTYIAFATQPGNVALDGDGANSPFTAALLDHLDTPGQDIDTLMQRVRKVVLAATKGTQVPWSHSSLVDKFYFAPPQHLAGSPPSPDAAAGTQELALAALGRGSVDDRGTYEQSVWEATQTVKDPARRAKALEQYLARFPDGKYADLARIQIDDLVAAANAPGVGEPLNGGARELVKDAVLLAASIGEVGRKLDAATMTQGGAEAQLAMWRAALADMPPEAPERSTRSADIQRVEQRVRALEPKIIELERSLASSFRDYLKMVGKLATLAAEEVDPLIPALERDFMGGAGRHLAGARQFALLQSHVREWRERNGRLDGAERERWLESLDEQRRSRLERAITMPKLAPSP